MIHCYGRPYGSSGRARWWVTVYRRMRRRTDSPAATGAALQPGGDTDRPTTLAVTISADPSELSGLRSRVAEFARRHRGSDDVIDDLELVVSELATNVVRHTTDPKITVTLSVVDDAGTPTETEPPRVFDPAPRSRRRWTLGLTGASAIPGMDDLETPPVEQEGGRGLLIVSAVADAIEVDREAGIVRCTLVG